MWQTRVEIEHSVTYLDQSTALQCFERDNAVEICNGTMFDFYMGLPHVFFLLSTL